MKFRLFAMLALGVVAFAGGAQACSYVAAYEGLDAGASGAPYVGAEGKDWFVKGEALEYAGSTYAKSGPSLKMGDADLQTLVYAGDWQGVRLFIDVDDVTLEVIVVPVNDKACTFQRYRKNS